MTGRGARIDEDNSSAHLLLGMGTNSQTISLARKRYIDSWEWIDLGIWFWVCNPLGD